MKKILVLLVSFASIFVLLGLMPIHGEAEVYDSVIRLHVIANSDSEEDQKLKLKVRDAVLECAEKLFDESRSENIEEARADIEKHMPSLLEAAKNCIVAEGYEYPVEIILGEETYPTKKYEVLAFPSGNYLSLRVRIGDAKGENWWCVLFPPLCLSAATESKKVAENEFTKLGFSGEQYKIITDSENATYNVRFKILETVEKLFS